MTAVYDEILELEVVGVGAALGSVIEDIRHHNMSASVVTPFGLITGDGPPGGEVVGELRQIAMRLLNAAVKAINECDQIDRDAVLIGDLRRLSDVELAHRWHWWPVDTDEARRAFDLLAAEISCRGLSQEFIDANDPDPDPDADDDDATEDDVVGEVVGP